MERSRVPVAAQIGGRPTRPQVIPPQGPVRQVIFKNCTSCHGIDDYAFNALDRAGWSAYIDERHKDKKVTLATADRELLLDWLVSKFGPTTRPFPRTYVAQDVTTFFSDGEADEVLKRSCTTCHTIHERAERHTDPLDGCGTCHEDAAADYATSVHHAGRKQDGGAATCASCHGTHHVLAVADSASPV